MESTAETSQKRKKRRAPWQKYGKMRYIYRHIKQIENALDRMEKRQRIILDALGQLTMPSRDFLTLVVCKDEVDTAILNQLYEAGPRGLYPVVIAENLPEYGLTRFMVTYRIQRMNKRLKKELDQVVAEKRGWRWSLTKTVYDIWGATREEINMGTNGS